MQIANLSGLPGSVHLTASIGVAISKLRDTVTEFLSRSDEALYQSKRTGRNLVSVYHESEEQLETADPIYVPST
jgi:PleD family two-component response regulator